MRGRVHLALDVTLGALVPLGLSRVDFLVKRVPSLGILRGPAAYVLLAVAGGLLIGSFLWRGERPRLARLARAPWWAVLLATFALYGAVGLHYAAWLPPTGDEPHYLVMAQSLWRDHDLDLRDEYEGEEWSEFTPGPVRPHWGAPRADGRPFPAHSPGLPLLLAPAYAAFGREGGVILLALLGAGAALVSRQLALRLTGDLESSAWAWLGVVGPPLFFYSFLIYTEVPSALCASLALLLLLREPAVSGAALAALAASCLPWLHLKMLPASAALGLVGLVRLRGRARATFVLVALGAAASFALYYWSVFRVPSPLALYGGLPAEARTTTWRAAIGLLLDRSYGLLPVAPVYLVALAGLPDLLRRRSAWPYWLLGLAVLGPVLFWRMWWGGQCPPGRFLVPTLPFLGVALALRLSRSRGGLVRWLPGLLAVGYTLSAVAVAEPGARLLLNRGNRPTRLWAALSGDVALGDYLPSLTHASHRDARVALVWLSALVLVLVLDRLASSRPWADRAFSRFSVAMAILLLVGVAVDLGVGPPAPALVAPSSPVEPMPVPVARATRISLRSAPARSPGDRSRPWIGRDRALAHR
jgi:hypothetical protein